MGVNIQGNIDVSVAQAFLNHFRNIIRINSGMTT